MILSYTYIHLISHIPWNRREEKLNSFNFFSSEYYITKINSCYSNNILDRKKILSCQNASNGIFWASRFHFFSGEECPQKSLVTHTFGTRMILKRFKNIPSLHPQKVGQSERICWKIKIFSRWIIFFFILIT